MGMSLRQLKDIGIQDLDQRIHILKSLLLINENSTSKLLDRMSNMIESKIDIDRCEEPDSQLCFTETAPIFNTGGIDQHSTKQDEQTMGTNYQCSMDQSTDTPILNNDLNASLKSKDYKRHSRMSVFTVSDYMGRNPNDSLLESTESALKVDTFGIPKEQNYKDKFSSDHPDHPKKDTFSDWSNEELSPKERFKIISQISDSNKRSSVVSDGEQTQTPSPDGQLKPKQVKKPFNPFKSFTKSKTENEVVIPSVSDILHQGYLMVKGEKSILWYKRFCIVTLNRIVILKGPKV
jgi:hypothetical protein